MSKICGVIEDEVKKDDLDVLVSPMEKFRNYQKEYFLRENFGICRLFLKNETSEIAENDNFTVVFSGYLLDFKKETNTAGEILKLFSERKTDFIKELNGVFNIAIYDKNNQTGYLINDRCGVSSLYYSSNHKRLIFASEVKSIIQDDSVSRGINWEAWRDYFSFRYILGEKTFFKNIKSLSNASILAFCKGEIKIENYWDYNSVKIDRKHDISYFVNEGANLIKQAVQKTARGVSSPVCFLSGGYDSRCLASSLTNYTDIDYTTYTTEHPTGENDPIIAKQVADKLGVKNIFVKHPADFYKKYFVKKIELTEGMSSEHIWSLPLAEYLKGEETIFDGLAGDLLLKGLFLDNDNYKYINRPNKLAQIIFNQCGCSSFFIKQFFNKKIQKELKGGKRSLKDELDKIPKNDNKVSIFFAANRTRNCLSLISGDIFANQIKRFPFLESKLVEFSLSIPPEIKVKDHIYLKILQNSFPEIMKLSSTNDKRKSEKINIIFEDLMIKTGLYSFSRTVFKNFFFAKYFTFKQSDILYIKSLVDKLEIPDYVDKEKILSYTKNSRFDFAFFSVIEFLVWYNLFCLKSI